MRVTKRGYKRKPYKSNMETRGIIGEEFKAVKSFWKKHKMDDIIQLEGEELDKLLNSWIEEYEARQIKQQGRSWWYPEDPLNGLKKIRKTKSKYLSRQKFNGKLT